MKKAVLGAVFFLLVVLIVRVSYFKIYKIPSQSMLPTFLAGDFVLVDQWDFFWDSSLPLQRGEIVIFESPNEPQYDFIKRVMGLPGETYEEKENLVLIDGKDLTQTPLNLESRASVKNTCLYHLSSSQKEMLPENLKEIPYDPSPDRVTYSLEQTQENKVHLIRLKDYKSPLNTPSLSLSKNDFFARGDNRNDSKDSTHWGPVALNKIKGKAIYILFSYGKDKHCGEKEDHFRWERLGRRL